MSQNTNGKVREGMPETEVVKKASGRQCTAEYKLRVLAEIDACKGSGQGRRLSSLLHAVCNLVQRR